MKDVTAGMNMVITGTGGTNQKEYETNGRSCKMEYLYRH